LFKKVGKAVLNRHKKSETYKQVSDCLSSGGSVNRSLSDLRCAILAGLFCIEPPQLGRGPFIRIKACLSGAEDIRAKKERSFTIVIKKATFEVAFIALD
ncbi:hypothetical protein, partial [Shewanella algae]